jgi:IS30 family transposase
MPRVEIHHPERTRLPDELRHLLQARFTPEDLQKLERLGGRVTVSIASPYRASRSGKDAAVQLDDGFYQQLREVSASADDLQQMLQPLTVKQLREVAERLGQPVRSGATAGEIRAGLIRALQSRTIWKAISGSRSD